MRTGITTILGVIVTSCLILAAPAEAQYTVTTGGVNVNTSDGAILAAACFYARSIAIRPDGKTAWGTEVTDGLLGFDPNHCAQFEELDGGFPSRFAAYTADGRRLFVVGDNKLSTVDTFTRRLLSSLEVFEPYAVNGGGSFDQVPQVVTPQAAGVVASPDGRFIYVPARDQRTLVMVDARTMELFSVVDDVDDTNFDAIALKWSANEDEGRLYLGGSSGYISVYNGVTLELVTSFLIGQLNQDSVTHMALSPDNSRLYMTTNSGKLLVLDTATNAIISTIALPAPAGAVAVTPDGRHLFVPGLNTKNLFDVDALTGTLLNTIVVSDVSPFDPTMAAAIGRLTFASMTASATLTSGLYEPFSMSGTFSLADGRSIDPAHEDVTIAISTYVFWSPAGSFVETTPGVFDRQSDPLDDSVGYPGLNVEIRSSGGNSYAFTISGTGEAGGVDTDGEVLPLQALVVVGDDGGMATLDLNAGLQQTVSSLQSDLSTSQAQVASLTTQNNTLVQANAGLNAQIEPLTQQVATLTAQIQPLTDQVQTLTTLNGSLTTANTQLTADNTQLAAANAQLTGANAQLTAANHDLTARNARLSERDARIEAQLEAAHETIATLRARIDALRGTIDQKDARIEDLKARLDAANATIEALRAQIKDLKR